MFHSCVIQKELNAAKNCAFSGTIGCAQETEMEKEGQNTLTQKKRQGVRLHVHCLQVIVDFSACIPPKASTKCPIKKSFVPNCKCISKERLLDLNKTLPNLFDMFCAFHKHTRIFLHNICAISTCDLCYACYWNRYIMSTLSLQIIHFANLSQENCIILS